KLTVTARSLADPTKSGSSTITLAPTQTVAVFQLNDYFGTSWPDQPIEFRYDGGQPTVSTTRMMGPNGAEVPYQWVSACSDPTATRGCILVRSGLPANTSYTWTLQTGAAPAATPTNPVRLNQTASSWELTNGLTGVRIIAPAANPSPWNKAPIQGVLMSNGIWTGVG